MLIFLLLGGWTWKYFTVETTKVPDVLGKTVPVAGDFIKQAKLKLSPDVTYEFSDKVEKDRIVEQDPKAETTVKVDRQINVVVSKGPDMGKFPDVTTGQMSKADAENLIQNKGFTAKITYDSKPNPTVPKDDVSEQDPAVNASWPKNGPIHLTLSAGPQLITINMPNVIGKTSTDAQKILEGDNKFDVQVETQDSTTFPVDVVISTTPNPGETVQQGDQVTMVVSRGPGPVAAGVDAKAILAQILGVVFSSFRFL